MAREGIGLLLVTHHLPDIIPEIQRVVCLKGGRLFLDGPKAQVLRTDVLRDLFGVEVRLVEHEGGYSLH